MNSIWRLQNNDFWTFGHSTVNVCKLFYSLASELLYNRNRIFTNFPLHSLQDTNGVLKEGWAIDCRKHHHHVIFHSLWDSHFCPFWLRLLIDLWSSQQNSSKELNLNNGDDCGGMIRRLQYFQIQRIQVPRYSFSIILVQLQSGLIEGVLTRLYYLPVRVLKMLNEFVFEQ